MFLHHLFLFVLCVKVTFDAKRDRWLGYHPDEHKHTIDRYTKIDQERRRSRREAAEKQEERRKVCVALGGGVGWGEGGGGHRFFFVDVFFAGCGRSADVQ